MTYRIQAAVRNDRGRVRQNNEDNFLFLGETMPLSEMDEGARLSRSIQTMPQLYAICDGMGGEEAGEEASTLVVEKLGGVDLAEGLSAARMQTIIEEANDSVCELRQRADNKRVGCTIVSAYLDVENVSIFHVGDSRAYRIHDGQIIRCTRDHTEIERLIDLGLAPITDNARKLHRNALLQHIGMTADEWRITVEAGAPIPLSEGDIWILCSDGLSDMVPDEAIKKSALQCASAKEICERLVDDALRAGGRDNVTVIALRVLDATVSELQEEATVSLQNKRTDNFERKEKEHKIFALSKILLVMGGLLILTVVLIFWLGGGREGETSDKRASTESQATMAGGVITTRISTLEPEALDTPKDEPDQANSKDSSIADTEGSQVDIQNIDTRQVDSLNVKVFQTEPPSENDTVFDSMIESLQKMQNLESH